MQDRSECSYFRYRGIHGTIARAKSIARKRYGVHRAVCGSAACHICVWPLQLHHNQTIRLVALCAWKRSDGVVDCRPTFKIQKASRYFVDRGLECCHFSASFTDRVFKSSEKLGHSLCAPACCYIAGQFMGFGVAGYICKMAVNLFDRNRSGFVWRDG